MNQLAHSIEPQINLMQSEMMQMEQADCPVIHSFLPGLYIRELHMKAGTFAIGHFQKFHHVNVFEKGRITIVNEDGTLSDMTAPMEFIGEPGRKCGFVHEDTIWLNIYSTDETDIEKLEEMFLDKDKSPKATPLIVDKSADIADFKSVLNEVGFAPETVRKQSEDETDQIPLPHGSYKFGVFPSPIEGRGIFATFHIEEGEIIAPASINGKRTPVGRFCNHSATPNAKMVIEGKDILLVATRDIEGSKGSTVGEEITTDYRENVSLIRRLLCQE